MSQLRKLLKVKWLLNRIKGGIHFQKVVSSKIWRKST